jgi:hypothetical protein
MDQILHRKLINEKNNLELQVAKANKQIAKLMETVQQYEAVLASLNEETPVPTNAVLRGTGQSRKIVAPKTTVEPKPKLPLGKSEGHELEKQKPTVRTSEPQERPKFDDSPHSMSHRGGSVQEGTLVRGMEAAKLKAQMSGKKLPTAAEAAKQTKKIEAEKELDQAGLGKLKKSRLQIDEVLDTAIDKKLAANVAKHSLKQVKDEQDMLGRMPGITPARMTLLKQKEKNRESLMNRLGEKA